MEKFPGDSAQALFNKLTHVYFLKTFHQLQHEGLHPGQVPLIRALREENNLSQKELAEKLHVKPPTVNVTVRRLEQAGYVCRMQDPRDLRISRIQLTEKGKDLSDRLYQTMKENERILFSGFSETETCLLKRLFRQMIENVQAIPVDCENGEKGTGRRPGDDFFR